MRGNPRVFAVLADRAYGKVKTQVEVDGGALDAIAEQLIAARKRVLEGMSDAELCERLEQLESELSTKTEG